MYTLNLCVAQGFSLVNSETYVRRMSYIGIVHSMEENEC